MKTWIAFSSILVKDLRTYYLKPPNISWGIIFPISWTLMTFMRSETIPDIIGVLPGVVGMSILFGTTSMLAVAITFERRARSFERLLVSPIPVETLLLAKTLGAVLFGVANAFVPIILGGLFADLSRLGWFTAVPAIVLTAVTSTFLGLFIAVSVSEVFEAQTFSNFFRFPMVFLCGLFFPIEKLPVYIRPLSYVAPLTYGVDLLKWAVTGTGRISKSLSLGYLVALSALLFSVSVRNVKKRWIE